VSYAIAVTVSLLFLK